MATNVSFCRNNGKNHKCFCFLHSFKKKYHRNDDTCRPQEGGRGDQTAEVHLDFGWMDFDRSQG